MNEKLIVIQQKLKAPKNQENTYGGYRYRSCEDILEAVKPILKELDLTLRLEDELVQIGDRYYVKATAILSNGTDEIRNSSYAREEEKKKGFDESQITGASSSYARKYALNGLLLIDDMRDSDFTNASKKIIDDDNNEKLKLMVELNKIFDEKDIDRDELYKQHNVSGMKDFSVKQLKEFIKELSNETISK